jgi:hypothetical protein
MTGIENTCQNEEIGVFWAHVRWQISTSNSEEHAASIFMVPHLDGVISQKTVIFVVSIVRAPNLTFQYNFCNL